MTDVSVLTAPISGGISLNSVRKSTAFCEGKICFALEAVVENSDP
jgi:hypothetical protein